MTDEPYVLSEVDMGTDAIRKQPHVHAANGKCLKNRYGPICNETDNIEDEAEEWADFIRGITELAYQTGWNDHSKYIDYTIQTGTLIPSEIVKSSGLIQLHNKIADLLNSAKEEEGQEQKTGSDAATDDPESPTD